MAEESSEASPKKKRKHLIDDGGSNERTNVKERKQEKPKLHRRNADALKNFGVIHDAKKAAIDDAKSLKSFVLPEVGGPKLSPLSKKIYLAKVNTKFFIEKLADESPEITAQEKVSAKNKLREIFSETDRLRINARPESIGKIDAILRKIKAFDLITNLNLPKTIAEEDEVVTEGEEESPSPGR